MVGKCNHNRRMGFAYEYRFAAKLLKQGARKVHRHYGSLGIMDIDWTDAMGFKNEAQLKFSGKVQPKVTGTERARIIQYAKKKKRVKIWIICKRSNTEHFLDTTHFSYYDGIDVFTKMLAEDYSGVLGYHEGGA